MSDESMSREDFASFTTIRDRITKIGGQTMFLHLADGKWLIRFLVPTTRGAKHGRYAEGVSRVFRDALAEALRGLGM